MFKPETKKPFKKYRERLYCITVGVGGVYLDSAKASLDINFSPKSF